MKVLFKNTNRVDLLAPDVRKYIDMLYLHLSDDTSPVKCLDGPKGHTLVDGIFDTEINIDERLNFLGRESELEVSKFPIFIFAKESLLLSDVFEGLHNRTYIDEEEVEQVRTFAEWAEENESNPIRHNLVDGYVLIRTEVGGVEMTVPEIGLLAAMASSVHSRLSLIKGLMTEGVDAMDIIVNGDGISEPGLQDGEIILWGKRELKLYESTYFPVVEE